MTGVGWAGWSLVALVCWGTWPILNKLALRTLGWPHLLVASWLVYTGVVLALLATRLDPRLLLSRDGALAVVAGLTSLVAVISFYLALRSGPVAAVTTLSALYPAVAALLAAVVLRERPSALHWGGVALAIAAGLLLTRP